MGLIDHAADGMGGIIGRGFAKRRSYSYIILK